MAWYDGQVTQSCSNGYYCDGSVEGGKEGGVDISATPGTPVTSVISGTVVGAGPCTLAGGGSCGGYVATVRGHVGFFGSENDVYVQHLSKIVVKKGDTVSAGQVIGYTGQLTEFGLNPPWFGVWGPSPHPGKWINPLKSGFLDSIKKGGGVSDNSPETACLGCGKRGSSQWQACVDQYHRSKTYPPCATPQQLSTDINNALGISQLGGLAQHLNDLISDPKRLIKGLIGATLLAIGLILMVKQLAPPIVSKAILGPLAG